MASSPAIHFFVIVIVIVRYRELGLDPWADPNPWQRLTREQQLAFNEAYLALGDDVQEFARQMFVTVSEAQQEHAFSAFLSLDLATLTAVLRKEMAEQAALAEAEAEVRSQKEFNFSGGKKLPW